MELFQNTSRPVAGHPIVVFAGPVPIPTPFGDETELYGQIQNNCPPLLLLHAQR